MRKFCGFACQFYHTLFEKNHLFSNTYERTDNNDKHKNRTVGGQKKEN